MGYFGSLRKCIKEISDNVNEIKKAKPEFLLVPEMEAPVSNIQYLKPEEIDKKHSEMEAKIRSTRIATSKVKTNLKHKQDVTTSYSYDIEDLILDIEDEYKTMEKKLVQYGYSPLEIVDPERELLPNVDKSSMNEQKGTKSVTPKLVRKRSTPELSLKPETGDKTPVLCLEEKPITQSNSAFPKKVEKYGEVARRLEFE